MATLRGIGDAEAWQMRAALVSDCKEALDGLQGVDAEEAWSLRESNADVWPSTVLKSLGPLADSARGVRLVQRLLAAHPGNISLLKHGASIALGLHHASVTPIPSLNE
jgi:hypothetical protein